MIDNKKISAMSYAGHIIALIQKEAKALAKPGVKLSEFNQLALKIIKENGGETLFDKYYGYKYAVCTSLNSTVVHGIPDDTILKNGDFFTLDVGVKYQGYCADAATTIEVGTINEKDKILIEATKEALDEAIKVAKVGNTLGDIGYKISEIAKKYNYHVSKQYAGHFIGTEMHQDPLVLNYGKKHRGTKLEEGMTICIEPIFINGKEDLFTDPLDGWSVKTKHGKNAVHEEQMIMIRKNGGEILVK